MSLSVKNITIESASISFGIIPSASYALTAASVAGVYESASYTLTSSYAATAQTLIGTVTSASYALTASYAANGGSSGGGLPFPDDPDTFGTPTADCEEFDTDLSAWTVVTSPGSPNTYTVNDTFSPSRLLLNITNTTSASIYITKALTINTSNDMSMTCKVSGILNSNFRNIGVGFMSSGTPTGAAGIWTFVAHSSGYQVIRRRYTNYPSTFTDSQVTFGDIDEPRTIFLHLQRVSGDWSLFYSADGATWYRTAAPLTDSVSITHIAVSMAGSTAGTHYDLSIDWVRFNRFFK